jgi:hypothetical protein
MVTVPKCQTKQYWVISYVSRSNVGIYQILATTATNNFPEKVKFSLSQPIVLKTNWKDVVQNGVINLVLDVWDFYKQVCRANLIHVRIRPLQLLFCMKLKPNCTNVFKTQHVKQQLCNIKYETHKVNNVYLKYFPIWWKFNKIQENITYSLNISVIASQ